MLETTIQKEFHVLVLRSLQDHNELNRLLAAAAISPHFSRLLLEDPLRAVREGFQGEEFHLENEGLALLLSMNADSLAALANLLAPALAGQQTKALQSSARVSSY
jgi:hypothetical protein